MIEQLVHGNYEYAGFRYWINQDESGRLFAIPHKGQHHAANRDRNRRNAAESFNDEYLWDKRI